MDLATTANLIVAAFELSAVRLIRNAMMVADLSNCECCKSAHPLGPDPNCVEYRDRLVIEPTPLYLPREHVRPAPTYDRGGGVRNVSNTLNGATVVEVGRAVEGLAAGDGCRGPTHPVEGPIPPVWKMLPPVEAGSHLPRKQTRVVRYQPNRFGRGMVVDLHA